MSEDLIERLREMSGRGYWPLLGDEAADEIVRQTNNASILLQQTQDQQAEIERLRAELAEAKAEIGQLKAAFFTGAPMLDEKLEECKRLADRYAVLYGIAEHGHPEAEDDLLRACTALHAALDALRGSQRGQAASSAVTSAARSS